MDYLLTALLPIKIQNLVFLAKNILIQFFFGTFPMVSGAALGLSGESVKIMSENFDILMSQGVHIGNCA